MKQKKLLIKTRGKIPHSLKLFLDYVGLKENEFNKILKPMQVYPYKHNFKKDFFKKTKDFSKWYKENKYDWYFDYGSGNITSLSNSLT